MAGKSLCKIRWYIYFYTKSIKHWTVLSFVARCFFHISNRPKHLMFIVVYYTQLHYQKPQAKWFKIHKYAIKCYKLLYIHKVCSWLDYVHPHHDWSVNSRKTPDECTCSSRKKEESIAYTFLNNNQVEDTKVTVNNAATDRFPLPLTIAAWSVAGVLLAKEETHTTSRQHTLHHWEPLLVIAARDAHNVALQ